MASAKRQHGKSFGEPTRVRTDGRATSGDHEDVPRGKPANTAYERYKQDLHAFFNGEKPLPGHLRDMLATRPGAAEHGLAATDEDDGLSAAHHGDRVAVAGTDASAGLGFPEGREKNEKSDRKPRRTINGPSDDVLAIVEQIRRANGPREVEAAVDALRGKGAVLPRGDAEVLSKALGHGNEDVVAEALRGLVELDLGQLKSPALLKTRVKNVMLLATRGEVKELGQHLLSRLG